MTKVHGGPSGLTVLRASGKRLCKVIHADAPADSYDLAKRFDLHEREVGDLAAIAALSLDLAMRRDCAVVRGAVADPARTRGVRRLLHRDPKTGEEPTLLDVPRSWLALDCDGTPLPPDTDPRDLEARGRFARDVLPPTFRDAACVIVATASHGIKPGVRVRAWFRLSRAMTGGECKRWLRGTPGLDLSTLSAAQITYTAGPLFRGMADSLPMRLVQLAGAVAVPCPTAAALAPLPRPPASPPSTATGGGYALAALARAAATVSGAAVDTRHLTAVSEAWGLARLVRSGLLTEDEVVRTIDGALQQAGKPAGEGVEIARWAIAQRQDTGTQPSMEGAP